MTSAYIEFHHIHFVENAPQVAHIFRHTIPYAILCGFDVLRQLMLQSSDVLTLQSPTTLNA